MVRFSPDPSITAAQSAEADDERRQREADGPRGGALLRLHGLRRGLGVRRTGAGGEGP